MTDFDRYCEIRDEDTLRAVVAHWLPILGLGDWGVQSHLVGEHELNKDQVGGCWVDLPRRQAQIYILRAETRTERWKAHEGLLFYGRATMEHDVVHELLHIWTKQCGLNDLDLASKEYLGMEQMVEAMAKGLRSLHSVMSVVEAE